MYGRRRNPLKETQGTVSSMSALEMEVQVKGEGRGGMRRRLERELKKSSQSERSPSRRRFSHDLTSGDKFLMAQLYSCTTSTLPTSFTAIFLPTQSACTTLFSSSTLIKPPRPHYKYVDTWLSPLNIRKLFSTLDQTKICKDPSPEE